MKLLRLSGQDANQQRSPVPDYHMTFKLVFIISFNHVSSTNLSEAKPKTSVYHIQYQIENIPVIAIGLVFSQN